MRDDYRRKKCEWLETLKFKNVHPNNIFLNVSADFNKGFFIFFCLRVLAYYTKEKFIHKLIFTKIFIKKKFVTKQNPYFFSP